MYRIDRLLNDFWDAFCQSGISRRELARRAGLHPNTLQRFGSKDWTPKPATLRSLEDVLLRPAESRVKAA